MPLWSLTKERVDKLLQMIGDKELAIDKLLKMTKEDLWRVDLDDFIQEWRTQLAEEEKRQKDIARIGRRASQKLKFGAAGPGKKRKAGGHGSDDSDFDMPKASKKSAAVRQPKSKPSGLLSEPLAKVNQPKPKVSKTAAAKIVAALKPENKPEDDVWMSEARTDGAASEPPVASIFQKTKAAAASIKPAPPKKVVSDDDDEDDEDDDPVVNKANPRNRRAAASKPVSYGIDSDSDANGNDMLFDVGKMVKGINGGSTDHNARPLFSTTSSMSRPGSSHGPPKKSISRPTDNDADETDYSRLAPPTTKKGPAVTAKQTHLTDDEDDSFDAMIALASKPAAKTATKSTKAEVPKTSKPAAPKATSKPTITKKAPRVAAAALPKKMPLSPAAKAYAAKQAKKSRVVPDDSEDDEDEVENLANEIMDDDDDDEDEEDEKPAGGRRPARRAASAKPKQTWIVPSGSEDEEDEEEESAMFDDGGDSDDY